MQKEPIIKKIFSTTSRHREDIMQWLLRSLREGTKWKGELYIILYIGRLAHPPRKTHLPGHALQRVNHPRP